MNVEVKKPEISPTKDKSKALQIVQQK